MKHLKATRVIPGDRWSIIDNDDQQVNDKEKIYSSLTECLNAIFVQTGAGKFYMDAKAGEVHIEDGVEPPVEIETYSMYGEEL